MTHGEYQFLLNENIAEAQQRVFSEYLNYVYTIVYDRLRSCGSREDISECVIDVFMNFFSSYQIKAEIRGDIKGFICTIAYRKAADYYRRLRKNCISVLLDDDCSEIIQSDENIAEAAEQNELRTLLLDLIESLGKPDSVIILEKYFYGKKNNEIAKDLHLTSVTVRVRSTRALKKLRKLLSDKGISL